ncbi:hypothetical protein ABE444_06070 [Brevundimonas pondensis]|uniref:hypothetical protein n=1 Tax=Brevundimonas pondensis TaxID=2774189 RepID=UPI0032099F5C
MTDIARRAATPWHLWLVGLLSLAWNGYGAFDYIQTNTRGEAYMRASGFGDAAVAYFFAMPTWMYVPWTMGVWGAVLGSLLLLARSRWAVHAFAISLIGAFVSVIYTYFIGNGLQALGPIAHMQLAILAIAALLLWYASAMAKKAVLR